MSITLDLSEELVAELKRLSEITGKTAEEIVRRGIEMQVAQTNTDIPNAKRAGLADLMQFAGCIDSGSANSADNDQIDEDLARAYAGHVEAA